MDANWIGGDMLKALGSRLTYANVMATVAVFLALGGGAYALSGIPDRGGVFHGCVSNATGTLRVVKSARSCQKAKTIRRQGKRVRLPGEFAVSWNQRGLQGLQGVQGQKGDTGGAGQNATRLFAYIHDQGGTATPNVQYGSGVTAVSRASGNNPYFVTFERSLTNCVVQAVPGIGDPGNFPAAFSLDAVPNLQINPTGFDPTRVEVDFRSGSTTAEVDTSFMITAFC